MVCWNGFAPGTGASQASKIASSFCSIRSSCASRATASVSIFWGRQSEDMLCHPRVEIQTAQQLRQAAVVSQNCVRL